jgi:hypothetical protein
MHAVPHGLMNLCKVPDDAGADGPVQEVEETRVWAFITYPKPRPAENVVAFRWCKAAMALICDVADLDAAIDAVLWSGLVLQFRLASPQGLEACRINLIDCS